MAPTVSGGLRRAPEELVVMCTNQDPARIEHPAVRSRLVPVLVDTQQVVPPLEDWKASADLIKATSVLCLPALLSMVSRRRKTDE